MEDRGIGVRIASRWFEGRLPLREYLAKARKEQEDLRVLEQENPWLGSIKGILRKKDGKSFEIPEGPRPSRAAPAAEKPVAGPSTRTPALRREEK
jgi:hypothetical protein